MKKIYTSTLLCAAILLAAACGSEKENGPVMVASMQITPGSVEFAPGETVELSVTVTPEDAANKAVTWSSDNEAVATVYAYSEVNCKSVGSATITATAADGSGKTATCVVTVKEASILGSWVAESQTGNMTITFAKNGTYSIVVPDEITEEGTYSYWGGKTLTILPETANGEPVRTDLGAWQVACKLGLNNLTIMSPDIFHDVNPHGFMFPLKLSLVR